ncbi:low temperature requirement protein A [Mycobacterium sp.]|uniref:low temperature requirement protein A n=1 Tax=Mycobacterium sp. TaxID=1785 RepID=UPI002BCDA676|nr:low temperature requirement protein A [Mycobacterium sp.]HTY32779.1 low temperature requirement protein A [Mycobacterium sp.]
MTEVESQRPAGLIAAHHLRRMTGRDPDERARVATPLELLFDLTFVVAFGVSASEFAHQLAAGHVGAGLVGFAFTTFAVCWAWVNFSWFSSAYDTDDWGYRLATMLQMVGVVILTMGIPPVFSSIEEGEHVDNRVLVAGYVVMRIAMVFQWLRAARQDKARRTACLTYAITISVAQCGWIASIFLHTSVSATMAIYIALIFVETMGPWIAEGRSGGTPWHAHHIAERYGLLTIIALGEGVLGTVASLTAVVAAQGWTVDAVLVALAGIGLTFGMWWLYFVLPAGAILHAHRDRSVAFGYGHIVIFVTIVATGAGLHAAAYFLDHHSNLDSAQTVLTVGAPVGVYMVGIFVLYVYLVRGLDVVYAAVLLFAAVVLVAAVLLASSGIAMGACLLIVTMAPVAVVIGFETVGHRHVENAVARALSQPYDGDEMSTEPPSGDDNNARADRHRP